MMRYSFYLLILLLAACQSPQGPIEITGSVQGLNEETDLILEGPSYYKEFKLDNGDFKQELDLDKEGIYHFTFGRNRAYTWLTPKDNISFQVDMTDKENPMSFEGDAEISRQYFTDKMALNRTLLSGRTLYRLDVDEFVETIDKGMDSIKTIISSSNIPSALAAQENASLSLMKTRYLYNYPQYSGKERETLPEHFQNPLEGIDLEDPMKFEEMPAYEYLVTDVFRNNMYSDTTGEFEDLFMKHVSALQKGPIQNKLMYQDIQYIMGPNENLDKMYAFFNEHSTDEGHRAKIQEKFDNLQSLRKGQPSPSFNYENYKGGMTSLKDLSGKYVYVDVWATWCGPCKMEIPFLKEKEEAYKDKNIEFVSISIDNERDYEKWRSMVKEEELGGQQLMADNAWESQFVQDYQINGIPRFILIDPNGKIVSADAPRPSNDKLDETLESLNI